MSNSVFAYQDTNRATRMIDESNVNFTGTWSSSGTYVATDYDAVVYGAARYIAIVDNVGGVPTYVPRRGQAKWSSLVLIRSGTNTGGHTADEAYALALDAMDAADAALLAANDAAALGEQADTVAGIALVTAWAGTAAAANALAAANGVSAGVDVAIEIASTGTDNAYLALQTAWSGTNGANAAMSVAVRGTNAAAIAEAHSLIALQTAWAGTAAGAIAEGHAAQALTTAWAGTAAAATADAHANAALQTAWQGTQTANLVASWFGTLTDVGPIAQQGSQFAVMLRDQGTHYTDDQVRISSQQDGQFAFDLYVAGTNYTNQTAFSAGSAASQLVFWAGTDYTNVRIGAEAAARIAGDNQIFSVAVQGTNAAALADIHANTALQAAWAGTTASLPLAGGTLTGNLRVPQLLVGSGTVPASSAVNGTIYYDFLGPAFQETTVDRNIQVSAKNYTPGAEISAVLVSSGQQKVVTYDAEYSWFGTQVPVTPTIQNKKVLVALASTGTLPSKVIGASTPQI